MTKAKVLLFDIENVPMLAWVWQRWQTDVVDVHADTYLISVAWKWLGEKKAYVEALPDFPRYGRDPEDDYHLALRAHDLFDEADIVVAHNGVAFDTKRVQARMLAHEILPPSPFKEVDTLRVARQHFAFTSNKLDELCKTLGIAGKIKTGGFDLWLGCIQGDPAAWAKMKRYNKHDVIVLEQLYLRLLPWISNHPNLATITDVPNICPRCGSDAGFTARGWGSNSVTRYHKYQCRSCGGWVRGRANERVETMYR